MVLGRERSWVCAVLMTGGGSSGLALRYRRIRALGPPKDRQDPVFFSRISRACFELAYVDNNGHLVITDRFGTPLPRAAEPREANAARPARGAAHSAAPASGLARSVVAMHAMSLCDYILGPPSTFSGWASFMGRVQRLQLKSRDQAVRLEDFVTPS